MGLCGRRAKETSRPGGRGPGTLGLPDSGLLDKLPWVCVSCARRPRTEARGCGHKENSWGQRCAGEPQGPSAPALPPPGAVLVSGVYDLEPILHTYVNDALNMSR